MMDRGIPTEETLAKMRQPIRPSVSGGNPQGRLPNSRNLLSLPWSEVRPGVEVKLLAEDDDLYVFAQSRARSDKERAMRKRQLSSCGRDGEAGAHGPHPRELLMKLAPPAPRRRGVAPPRHNGHPDTAAFTYALNRKKLRQARRREGRYLLRPTCAGAIPPSCGGYIRLSKSRRPSRL